MICIYVDDRQIILDSKNKASHKDTKEITSRDINSLSNLKKFTNDFLNHLSIHKLILIKEDPMELFHMFTELYSLIDAAGGLVFNEQDELLMIYRRGYWDLPKGKTEPEETVRQSAIREIEEETGIISPVIRQKLPETYHMYQLHGEWVVKRTQWFHMYAQKQSLKPQTEEDISQAIWVPLQELHKKTVHTYHSLIPVIEPYVR